VRLDSAYAENQRTRREALAIDISLSQKVSDTCQDSKALAGALGNLQQYIFSKASNGVQELQPPLARDKKFLKRLRRIQRKMDRQKRAANPECFNPDGTWKKGKRAKHLTHNLVETHTQIQRLHERQVNVRREFYHVTAYDLLRQHEHIILDKWRPPIQKKNKKRAKKGQAMKRRNINRKSLDHAISMFESILKDKASLSATPRIVEVTDAAGTTRTCACCKAETGPQEPIRVWTCGKCGVENHRKANAAENIRLSATQVAVTAGAQPVAAPV
jgi:ribosomal protein L37AE/L43A